MFHDLFEAILKKIRGAKKAPLSSDGKEQQEISLAVIEEPEELPQEAPEELEEIEKPEKPKKQSLFKKPKKDKKAHKPEKEMTIFTLASTVICIVLALYWTSLGIEFAISPRLSFEATMRRYVYEPFGIEVIYDIQWSSLEDLGDVKVGDVIAYSPTDEKCSQKSPCINMTVLKIYEDDQVFLGFTDNTLPIVFTMEEFYNIVQTSEKGRTSNRFIIHGKLTDETFFIDKIELAPKF